MALTCMFTRKHAGALRGMNTVGYNAFCRDDDAVSPDKSRRRSCRRVQSPAGIFLRQDELDAFARRHCFFLATSHSGWIFFGVRSRHERPPASPRTSIQERAGSRVEVEAKSCGATVANARTNEARVCTTNSHV